MWSGGVALVLVLGAAHVAARAAGARAVADLSKAVPIALLAGLVAAEPAPVGQAYRWLVFAGLLCSLGGDVWLLFPRGFVAGLFNFLVAHLLYIAAFAPGGPWNASAWALLAPFALVSLATLRYLWPHLGRERAPVAVYVSVIAVMGWRAAVRALAASPPPASGGLAPAGARRTRRPGSAGARRPAAAPAPRWRGCGRGGAARPAARVGGRARARGEAPD